MRWVFVVALAGLAGVWAFALFAPKDPVAPPERFCGRFVIVDYRQTGESEAPPFPPGQERRLFLREDGSYLLSVLVTGGKELFRQEGSFSVSNDDALTLHRVSENRHESPAEDRFVARWEGDVLVLRNEEQGYEFHLRKS